MKPNLVFFIAEDLDYEGLEVYESALTGYTGLHRAGNPYAVRNHLPLEHVSTPNLRSLAEEGIVMDNYWCAAPVCTAARYTLFTGCFPERSAEVMRRVPSGHETVWFDASLSPGEPSLPQALKKNGYATAYVGKFHNFPKDFHHEMENAYYPEKPLNEASQDVIRSAYECARNFLLQNDYGLDHCDRLYFDNPEPFQPQEISSHNPEWITQGAVEYIKSRQGAQEPFLLYTALTIPHQRYSKRRFLSSDRRSSAMGYLDAPSTSQDYRDTLLQRAEQEQLCGDAVEGLWLDDAFGAIREAVRSIGEDDNTIYVFTTDHPTAGKGSCHLGRIPLIIRYPAKISGGRRVGALASETDLVPTLLALMGVSGEEAAFCKDGRSFAALLTGESAGEPDHRPYAFTQIVNSRSVTDGKFKLIANRLPDASEERLTFWREEGWRAQEHRKSIWWNNDQNFPSYWEENELFDLSADPLEQHNLYGDPAYSKELARLSAALKEELCRLPHSFAEWTEESK